MTEGNQEVRETPETNTLREAAEYLVATFSRDKEQGFRSKDGAFVLDVLKAALASAPPPAVPDAVGVRLAKSLDWRPHGMPGTTARTPFGDYHIDEKFWLGCIWLGQKKFESLDEAKAAAQADFDRRILSSIEPTPSPEPQASNAGAVEEAFLRLCEEIGISATAGAYLEYRTRAALTTPGPQTGEQDGEESPYTWVKTQRVPRTSYVGGSLMLLAEDGHCVGTVKVMMGEGATEIDVHRALQTAGYPAKLQRFIRAARNGEQEANERAEAAERRLAEEVRMHRYTEKRRQIWQVEASRQNSRAEAAERRLAEVEERAKEDERDRLRVLALRKGACDAECFLIQNDGLLPADRAALRAKPEAQAIVGKEAPPASDKRGFGLGFTKGMTDEQLDEAERHCSAMFDQRGEHGGSPGEYWAEALMEIDTARKRRSPASKEAC